MAKRFLASVANVELFEKQEGKLVHFASAHTLTDSSIGFQISMEDVRGGQGAKLFGRFGHTTGMTLQMTDAMFDINYLRLNLGAQQSESNIKSVLVEGEQHPFDGTNDIQLNNTAVSIGHLCGLSDIVCWAKAATCESGTISEQTITLSGDHKTITVQELQKHGFVGSVSEPLMISFSYFKQDPASILFDVSATFIPGEVTAVMTAQEFAGDSASVSTGKTVGNLIVKIPRLQLDGQFDLGLNMTSAATISLNGSALATIDPVSGQEYYAEVLETGHKDDAAGWRANLTEIVVDQDYLGQNDAPVILAAYSQGGSYPRIEADKIANQLVVKESDGTSAIVSGFIYTETGGSTKYVAKDLAVGGKWPTAGTVTVCVFKQFLTDAEYALATAYADDGGSATNPVGATTFIDTDGPFTITSA